MITAIMQNFFHTVVAFDSTRKKKPLEAHQEMSTPIDKRSQSDGDTLLLRNSMKHNQLLTKRNCFLI